MEKLCPICGYVNSIIARGCERCNYNFNTSGTIADGDHSTFTIKANTAAASIPVEAERKGVSALFVDIKSSVELMADIDAEEAQSIVDPALEIMGDAVLFYDGYVVQTLGDAVFALFGAPIAYKDHARHATYAAIEMRKALRVYSLLLEREKQQGLEVRIGINTGDVVLRRLNTGGRLEYHPIGHTINLASRLQSSARPGSIVISDSTRRLVEGYFELKTLDPLQLKGIPDPVAAFEVIGLGALRRYLQVSMTRGFTKFVGREREMEVLQGALRQAIACHGQIVAVVSEAGAGKSRLLFEFSRSLPPECRILEVYGLSHAKGVPWMPVVDMLTAYFDIRNTDEPELRREKAHRLLAGLDPTLLDALPYLHDLLGIAEINSPLSQTNPLIKRTRTLDAIKRILFAESQRHPIVLIFEDLHWMDAQSRSLLDLLAASLADAPILLIVTHRPEVKPEWEGRANYFDIFLEPLSVTQADQLLSTLMHESKLTPLLRKYIIERADGNPFFIEEIVRSLSEDGSLVHDGSRGPTPGTQPRVPQTIQATIAERIDRLPVQQKELLQTLAIIGTRTPLDLLVGVSGTDGAIVERMLVELQRADFVYAQTAKDQTIYVFKHVLTQEVTYQSLLNNHRKRLHGLVGATIESVYAESVGDHIGELAHHYSRSNDTGKAIEFLTRLGELEIQRSAHAEAAESLRAAMRLAETLPGNAVRLANEARLWLGLGVSLQATLGYAAPQVAEAFEKATTLSEQTGDSLLFVSAITGQSTFSIVRADFETAFRLAERLSTLDDPTEQYSLERLLLLGLASAYTGAQIEGNEYFLKALIVGRKSEVVETIQLFGPSRASAMSYLALTKWYLGYPEMALKSCADAVALAEELAIPLGLVHAQAMCGLLHHTGRNYQIGEQWIDKAIAGATEGGFPYWQMLGLLMKASIMVEAGEKELGLLQFDTVYRMYRDSGAKIGTPWLFALHAEMLAKAEQYDRGLIAIEEALSAIAATNERYHEAEVYRLRGVLLLGQGRSGAAERAETDFHTSLKIARTRRTKMIELRAATSTANLYLATGRAREAFDLLGTIYVWFDEGLESKDLEDASFLLSKISGLL